MIEISDFLNIKIGVYVDFLVKWLMRNYGNFFEAIGSGILWFLLNVERILVWLPWWIFVIAIFITGWRVKKIWAGLLYAVLLVLIGGFGYWQLMMATLSIVLTSVVISILIGIPMGILIAYNRKIELLMKPILDAMQTMPSFVYLIPALMLFGLGKVPSVFATTIYALPPMIRLTDLGIRSVPQEMVEAAHSFGSTTMQTLTKVQLPQAVPTIMTGINQTTMMALGMVVISSMIGANGLGMEVLIAISRIDIARGFDAGISIVILAIIIDRLSQGIANKYKIPK